ncbi:MAG TPA: nickel-binding protein [Dehalococcoidia bacterium]|nr:nickel-binding protein [Dehalococcoidia bacterium]
MGVYLVDRVFPGATLEQIIEAQRAVVEMSQRFAARGEYVRYLRSIYIPGESRCLCLFEAPDAQRVEEVNEVARAPFTRIIEAVDLSPEEG